MVHAAALAGAIIWLGLNGLLWYTRPSDLSSLPARLMEIEAARVAALAAVDRVSGLMS